MSGQPVTPATITMIPSIIAIAVALAGFLLVNKIASNERSHCDEVGEVLDRMSQFVTGVHVGSLHFR